jgi:sigma-B regulation protein RsbU (phosphoserine phosphatase)
LPHTDFVDPAAVLGALNLHFQMEHQNNMYFTIWYGVYDVKTCQLRYASAGAPPGLLVPPVKSSEAVELTTTDMIIGVDSTYSYENREHVVAPGSRLYLFSDGVYEIRKSTGKMLVFREFSEMLTYQAHEAEEGSTVQALFHQIQGLAGVDHFEDDFSLLELSF